MSHFNSNRSRRSKIKKLFNISRELIHGYGFVYFFRIGIQELRKQKLHLFSPDVIPEDVTNQFTINYDDFLSNLPKNHVLFEQLSHFSHKPKFAFVIFLNGDYSNVLNSIQNQIYENFELILINSNDDEINSFTSKNNLTNFHCLSLDSLKIKMILDSSDADYFVFFDQHIVLHNDFLYRIVESINENSMRDFYYFDHDYVDKTGKRYNPFFKPDWSPYLLHSFNYIGNVFAVHKKLLSELSDVSIELHDSDYDLYYDLVLRCFEYSEDFAHIPIPCQSISHKSKDFDNTKILSEHLTRLGIHAKVEPGIVSGISRVHYTLNEEPKVSIIIPTKNNKLLLKRCIDSIEHNTNYKNWEIIIVDNNSNDQETKDYLNSLPYQILSYAEPFNFSKMNNIAISQSSGDYILSLNDDTKAIDPNWLTEMVSICQLDDVGVVGAKLLHSNGTIQHAGTVFLKSGAGFHIFENFLENDVGFFNMHNVIRDFSVVTGACLLTKKIVFEKVNGYDDNFDLFYGDADLCLKLLHSGLHVVYTPFARLLHEGSSSLKKDTEIFFAVENHHHFIHKWNYIKNGDPFYNKNLGWNYTIKKTNV